jgi:hypothetical protein
VKWPLVNDFIVTPAHAGMTNKSGLPQVGKYYFHHHCGAIHLIYLH